MQNYYNTGKQKADKSLDVYLKDEREKAKKELDEHLSMLDKVQVCFSSVINFVATCIHRSLNYNSDIPTKAMLEDVNGNITKIYDEFKYASRADFKIIDDFLDYNEKELNKYNLKVGFVSSVFSKIRKAKILP